MHALGQQVRIEAGSQLIAHFDKDLDAAVLLNTIKKLLMDALTSMSGLAIEIAKGCTIVYITFSRFKEASQASVMKLLGELLKLGATVTQSSECEHQSGILQLQVEGPHRTQTSRSFNITLGSSILPLTV